MALLRKSNAGEIDEVAIPDPRDDVGYARALELLSEFNGRYDRLEREKQRLDLEQHFAGREAKNDDATGEQLRAKLTTLRALPPLRPQQATAPDAPSAAIRAGLAVLAGEPVTTVPSRAAQIALIDRQLTVLSDAIREQTEVCAAILSELTVKYAGQLLPAWNALALEMYRDAVALSRSTTRFRAFRAAIMEKNIRTEILRVPNVTSPLTLGNEADYNSEITHWRRTLEAWGLL
jgi:hypothetical protein